MRFVFDRRENTPGTVEKSSYQQKLEKIYIYCAHNVFKSSFSPTSLKLDSVWRWVRIEAMPACNMYMLNSYTQFFTDILISFVLKASARNVKCSLYKYTYIKKIVTGISVFSHGLLVGGVKTMI